MSQTFEEQVAGELDGLYQGALFLAGGNARGAESLLVEAVTRASRERAFEAEVTSLERWLEARLVRSFLSRLGGRPMDTPPPQPRAQQIEASAFKGVGSRRFFEAAGVIPAWPRVALWLVLLRRWRYDDVAKELGVDRSVIVDLLRYRDVLMKEMIGPAQQRGARGFGS